MIAKLLITLVPITYIAVVWVLFGIQKSISDSYYRYYKTKWKYAFTIFCWSLAYPALLLSPTPIMFAAFILLGITGVSPAFKQDKYVKSAHMIGAYGGVLFSQLSISLDHNMFWQITAPFVVISVLLLLVRKKLKYNHIWFIEILSILSIYITLLT